MQTHQNMQSPLDIRLRLALPTQSDRNILAMQRMVLCQHSCRCRNSPVGTSFLLPKPFRRGNMLLPQLHTGQAQQSCQSSSYLVDTGLPQGPRYKQGSSNLHCRSMGSLPRRPRRRRFPVDTVCLLATRIQPDSNSLALRCRASCPRCHLHSSSLPNTGFQLVKTNLQGSTYPMGPNRVYGPPSHHCSRNPQGKAHLQAQSILPDSSCLATLYTANWQPRDPRCKRSRRSMRQ
jgi:hypothetical protein